MQSKKKIANASMGKQSWVLQSSWAKKMLENGNSYVKNALYSLFHQLRILKLFGLGKNLNKTQFGT